MTGINYVTMDQVQPEKITWLWPGRVPLGKLTVFDGDPGLGKSLVTLDLAARLSTGRSMADGSWPDLDGPYGSVLLTVEDGLADTIRPRLDLAGADTRLITAITGVPDGDDSERGIVLPDDWHRVFEVVQVTNARLVILDPLMALLGGDVNSYRDQDIRRALTPGVRFAEETGAALVVVRHLTKGGGTNAVYRGGGSIGITGAARSVVMFGKDPDEPETRRVMALAKSNLSAVIPALAYRVDDVDGHPRLSWDGTTTHTATDLLLSQDDDQRDAREEAKDYLSEALLSGPRPFNDIMKAAQSLRISVKTLRRASKDLGVIKTKQGFGDDGQWVWALPKMAIDPLRCPPKTMATLEGDGHLRTDGINEAGHNTPKMATESLRWPTKSMATLAGNGHLRGEPGHSQDDHGTSTPPSDDQCRQCGAVLYTSVPGGLCRRCRSADSAQPSTKEAYA